MSNTKNKKEILFGIFGIVLIILSKSGIFVKETTMRSALGYDITGIKVEMTEITYPMLIIGLALLIYAGYRYYSRT